MDVKKSKKASLEDKKLLFLLMGFVMVLSLLYIAFEWTKTEVTVYQNDQTTAQAEEEIEIVQTQQEVAPPPPPPAPEVVEVLNVVDDNVKVESIDINTEDDKSKGVDLTIPTTVSTGPVVEDEENVVFKIAEVNPSFPGGEGELMKFLQQNVKYPVIAQENGVQGRVICQFTVNKDGSIVDVEVVRSIDPSLDKEAIRVIKSMPKWNPGLQRQKPVRVKFTLPVNFKLQ